MSPVDVARSELSGKERLGHVLRLDVSCLEGFYTVILSSRLCIKVLPDVEVLKEHRAYCAAKLPQKGRKCPERPIRP